MGNDQGKTQISHQSDNVEDSTAAETNLKQTLDAVFELHTKSSTDGRNVSHLSSINFQEIFSGCPDLGRYLYCHCVSSVSPDTEAVHKEHFISWGLHILKMTSWQEKIDWIYSVFSAQSSDMSLQAVKDLFRVSFSVELLSSQLQHSDLADHSLLGAMEKSLFGTETSMSKSDFLHWCGRQCPRILDDIHPYVCSSLCQKSSVNKNESPFVADQAQAISEHLLSIPVLWAINSYIPNVFTVAATAASIFPDGSTVKHALADLQSKGGWQLLYSSRTQGLSINRFQHHIMSYAAPTLSLIQFEGHLYCVGSDEEWCDKSTRWGGNGSFLLQILPQFRVMQGGSQMLYLNTQDRKCPKGIQIGKDSRTTFLQIDEDFGHVKHYGIDIPLQEIEVWGCGSGDVLEKQKDQIKWESQMAQKSKDRKLKLEDWKDNPDRQILEYGGVTTEHAER